MSSKPKTPSLIKAGESDQREHAKAIYISMPIVRHSEVAKRSGASLQEVKQWLIEGRWLDFAPSFTKQKSRS